VTNLIKNLDLKTIFVYSGIFPEETGQYLENEEAIDLVHLDIDIYQSTKDAFEFLAPKIRIGGSIILDDYGFKQTAGVTKYINEIKNNPDWLFQMNLNGQAILTKRV